MLRISQVVTFVIIAASLPPLSAIEPERDFSGNWILDAGRSRTEALSVPLEQALTVVQQDVAIRSTATLPGGARAQWSYLLDGGETRHRAGEETWSSVVKWEGAALLVSTIVSGAQNYSVMDRWKLDRDLTTLTITRQVVSRHGETEGVLVYRREGQAAVVSEAPIAASKMPAEAPAVLPGLVRQPPPPEPSEIVVRAGTRIPLALRNTVDTKHSRDGDRIYLETLYPLFQECVLVVPRGSYVTGTVSKSTAPVRGTGKGELFIRFDTLILPNGVTRDFRSRLGTADTPQGQVDREEGKVTGERDKGKDARTVAKTTAAGATIGGIAGRSVKGAGIGGAAGAAVGLASIFLKRGADASLPQGTTVEMILDRDLRYAPTELDGYSRARREDCRPSAPTAPGR